MTLTDTSSAQPSVPHFLDDPAAALGRLAAARARPDAGQDDRPRGEWPPIIQPVPAARQAGRIALLVVAAIAFSLIVDLMVVSGFQHKAKQQRVFDRFRKELAEGTAPLGQTDASGTHLLAL